MVFRAALRYRFSSLKLASSLWVVSLIARAGLPSPLELGASVLAKRKFTSTSMWPVIPERLVLGAQQRILTTGATDKIQSKSDKDGLRKVTEIGILLPGAQASAVAGLTDLFMVANRLSAERGGLCAREPRTSRWRVEGNRNQLKRVFDRHKHLAKHGLLVALILPPSLNTEPCGKSFRSHARWIAARHVVSVDLRYDGSLRRIEPYSLRQTAEGYFVLHAIRSDSGEHRFYRVDRMQGATVNFASGPGTTGALMAKN